MPPVNKIMQREAVLTLRSLGFVRAGRAYVREDGRGGGIAVKWRDAMKYPSGLTSSLWSVLVCPGPYAQAMRSILPSLDPSFQRVNKDNVHILDMRPSSMPGYKLGEYDNGFAYRADDDVSVQVAATYLCEWLSEIAVPVATSFMASPDMMYETVRAGKFSAKRSQCYVRCQFEWIALPIFAAEAGRLDVVRECLAELNEIRHSEDSEGARYEERFFAAFREQFPELAAPFEL